MSYRINWVGNNPHIAFYGTIDTNKFLFVRNLFISDKRFDLMNYQLWDFRHVNAVKLTKEDISVLAALDISSSIWNKKMMIAFIAIEPNIIDLYTSYIRVMEESPWSIKLFDCEDDAQNWCLSREIDK